MKDLQEPTQPDLTDSLLLCPRVCGYCGNDLSDEELESPREDESGELMCDDCYSEHYEETCPICEDSYDKPTCPEETFFVLSKEAAAEMDMKGGIYKVLSWPYTVSCLIGGFENFNPGSVEVIKEMDINSTLQRLQPHNKKCIGGSEICPDCAKHYSMKDNFFKIRVQYCDPFYRLHHNIYERGVIQHGA